ncbi:MAG TPA: ankyrin repeat domain-containing protein [Candidatus Babeliales bacterium]|nr:ankyrin repeat domain-containing protein [Candidatus Babeliales bacterium]
MKKYVSLTLFLIYPLCHATLQDKNVFAANNAEQLRQVHAILTVLTEKPYLYSIKPQVKLSYQGTNYTFTPENSTQPIFRDMERNTPIHYAAKVGDVGDIKTLLSWDANIMSKNIHDETPLIKAVEGGNFRAIYYLLAQGAKITKSIKPFEHFNAFHYAVLSPKRNEASVPTTIKVLQALLLHDRHRTHLNESSRMGTPLEIALKQQLSPYIIRFLIRQGATITPKARKRLLKEQYASILKDIENGSLVSQVYIRLNKHGQ